MSAALEAAPSLLSLPEIPHQITGGDAGRLFQRFDDLPQVIVADALDAPAYLGSQVRWYLVLKHGVLVRRYRQEAVAGVA